jgi:hypothetical protein
MAAEQHTFTDPDKLVGRIVALLEDCEAVPLTITGNSMLPFLADGRDTVYLSKVSRPLRKGDMIFYRRDNGRYILHRVYRVESGRFWIVGDAQTSLEPGIRQDQVIAIVTAVRRKGKLLKSGSLCWKFFEKVWICMIPFRPYIFKVHALLSRDGSNS